MAAPTIIEKRAGAGCRTEIVDRVRTDDAEAEEREVGLRRKHRWLPI